MRFFLITILLCGSAFADELQNRWAASMGLALTWCPVRVGTWDNVAMTKAARESETVRALTAVCDGAREAVGTIEGGLTEGYIFKAYLPVDLEQRTYTEHVLGPFRQLRCVVHKQAFILAGIGVLPCRPWP